MAFEEVRGTRIGYATLEEGTTVVEGAYVETVGDGGKGTYHAFNTSDGRVEIWGAGQLNKSLAFVNEGALTRVVYKGKTEIQKGPNAGTLAHQFQVLVDKDAPSKTNKDKPLPF